MTVKLSSFKEEQLPCRSNAASHLGAAVLAHLVRSGRSEAALKSTKLKWHHFGLSVRNHAFDS